MIRKACTSVFVLWCLVSTVHAEAETLEPRELIEQAKLKAFTIPGQARALARLAWPAEPGDWRVSTLARQELIDFRAKAVEALYEAIFEAPPIYRGDVAAAMVETRMLLPDSLPTRYRSLIVRGIWFGTPDAQRIAIDEVARFSTPLGLLPALDAVYDHPELIEVVLYGLMRYTNPRARFFLAEMLQHDELGVRRYAAEALALMGGAGMDVLRDSVLADDPGVRAVAVKALLPNAGVEDLTTLYEYVARHGDDDARLLEQIRVRAGQLEAMLDAQQRYDSATPD